MNDEAAMTKYVTAVLPLFLFFLLDLCVLVLCVIMIGLFIALDDDEFPYSVSFARKVWL